MKSDGVLPETVDDIPPEIPPDLPLNRPEEEDSIMAPVPMVFFEPAERLEYRVLTHESLDAGALQTALNELGRDGWWLAQIVPGPSGALLVMMRRVED